MSETTKTSQSARGLLAARWAELRGVVAEVGSFSARQSLGVLGWARASLADIGIAFGLGIGVALYAVWLWLHLDFDVLSEFFDLWYESDLPRMVESLSDRRSEHHHRTNVHPLYSLLVVTPFFVLTSIGFSERQAATALIAFGAFILTVSFYALMRACRLPRLDAVLGVTLLSSTAAAVFWLSVPETYALGAASIVLALLWLAVPRGTHDVWSGPVQSAGTLSITLTNWVAGLVTLILGLGWRRAIWAGFIGFGIVALLTVVQYVGYPQAGRFLAIVGEKEYADLGESASLLSRITTATFHSLLAPAPDTTQQTIGDLMRLTVQTQAPAHSPIALVGFVGWLALIAGGVITMVKGKIPVRMSLAVAIILAAQIVLHLVYGSETFLYALHFAPLFALIAAWGLTSTFRPVLLGVMAVTALLGFWHNTSQFRQTAILFNDLHLRKERAVVAAEQRARPDDPWPAPRGHLVLGAPGAPVTEKAYLEPGGSFSPRPGAPGFAIWVYENNALVATSDTVDARHQFMDNEGGIAPTIRAETNPYTVDWVTVTPDRWRVTATPQRPDAQLALSIRSIGPASAAIHNLGVRDDQSVIVDECWRISAPGAEVVFAGDESADPSWTTNGAVSVPTRINSQSGWASARLAGEPGTPLIADIEALCEKGQAPLWPWRASPSVSPADHPLAEIIRTQQAQILMGLEGYETRPGDPLNYPLQWQRDGGYAVVALLRSGRTDVARDLIASFAENDFFGGFGAEADAPGIALWAINEVSRASQDRRLDDALWPHVQRKVGLISVLINTDKRIRHPFVGPVVPDYIDNPELDVVAQPAKDGLIMGRMDWHNPKIFINAFAWRGLMDAADFAARNGHVDEAAAWRTIADQLYADIMPILGRR